MALTQKGRLKKIIDDWYDNESVRVASNFCYRYERKEQKEIAELLGKFLIDVKISLDKKIKDSSLN